MSVVVLPLSSSQKLSASLFEGRDRLVEIDRVRLIHRITQDRLAVAALITKRWYRRLVAEPELASADLLRRLETALRALVAADAKSAQKAKTVPALLPGLYNLSFVVASQHYVLCPQAARGLLTGEERPADPAWRSASHSRQAALYIVNQALAVSQAELAMVARITPAAVCLGLKQVEDRRDDPIFDAFLDRAQDLVLGGAA